MLAASIIDLAMFLELSGEDVIDPDAAIRALESLAATLSEASPMEIATLQAVLRERLSE